MKFVKEMRRIVIAFVGAIILFVGIALLVLPGPGLLLLVMGLSILATEFLWAEKLLVEVKSRTNKFIWKKK